jgi:hypothetical protein
MAWIGRFGGVCVGGTGGGFGSGWLGAPAPEFDGVLAGGGDDVLGGGFGGVRGEHPLAKSRQNTTSTATTIPKTAPMRLPFQCLGDVPPPDARHQANSDGIARICQSHAGLPELPDKNTHAIVRGNGLDDYSPFFAGAG